MIQDQYRQMEWADSLIKAATFSMYHRGQINKQLRELGNEPPLVDCIACVSGETYSRMAATWNALFFEFGNCYDSIREQLEIQEIKGVLGPRLQADQAGRIAVSSDRQSGS
jgi:hypothetical protein